METHELPAPRAIDGIRTARRTYVEYGNGERELYDLSSDPLPARQPGRRRRPAAGRAARRPAGRAEELRLAANCRELEDLPIEGERTALRDQPDPPLASAQ